MLCIAEQFFFPLGSVARSQSRGFGLIFPLSCHSHCFHRIIRQSQSSNLEPMRKYSNQALLSVLATSRCFQHRLLRIIMLEAHHAFPYGWALHTAHPSLSTSPSPSLPFSTSPELPSWSYFWFSSFILHIQFIPNTCCLFPSSPLDQTSFRRHHLHPHLLSSFCSWSEMPSSSPSPCHLQLHANEPIYTKLPGRYLKFGLHPFLLPPCGMGPFAYSYFSPQSACAVCLSLCCSSLAHGIRWV